MTKKRTVKSAKKVAKKTVKRARKRMATELPLVILTIRGGSLTDICTDTPMNVVFIDWDDIDAGGKMQYIELQAEDARGTTVLEEAAAEMRKIQASLAAEAELDDQLACDCGGECSECSCD